MVNYRDPAAEDEDGGLFAGRWIAAIQQVRLPERARGSEARGSDLGCWFRSERRL